MAKLPWNVMPGETGARERYVESVVQRGVRWRGQPGTPTQSNLGIIIVGGASGVRRVQQERESIAPMERWAASVLWVLRPSDR